MKKRKATRIKPKEQPNAQVQAARVYKGQKLARVNAETHELEGIYEDYELTDLMKKPNMLELNDKRLISSKGDGHLFHKSFINSWAFLRREFSSTELSVALTLTLMSKAHTCSLEPLDDTATVRELSSIFNIGVNKVNVVLKKLHDYGVFGKFDVCLADKPYTRYWILNPFLSFNGTVIDSVIVKLFKGTHVERAFNDPNYVYNTTKYNLHLVTK